MFFSDFENVLKATELPAADGADVEWVIVAPPKSSDGLEITRQRRFIMVGEPLWEIATRPRILVVIWNHGPACLRVVMHDTGEVVDQLGSQSESRVDGSRPIAMEALHG